MKNIHQIQVLTEPLCRAQAIFYALPNNERGTKYCGLTYRAKKTVREIGSASQTRLRIYLTVSIMVVQSIETPQNTTNHPKTPQTSTKPRPLPYILAISYNARFLGHSWPFRGWGLWVWYWHCARIRTGTGLNDRQLF